MRRCFDTKHIDFVKGPLKRHFLHEHFDSYKSHVIIKIKILRESTYLTAVYR